MPRARPSAGAEHKGNEGDQCATVQRGIPALSHLAHLTEPSLSLAQGLVLNWGSPRIAVAPSAGHLEPTYSVIPTKPCSSTGPQNTGECEVTFCCFVPQLGKEVCDLEGHMVPPPKLCGEPEDKGHTHPSAGVQKPPRASTHPQPWASRKCPKTSEHYLDGRQGKVAHPAEQGQQDRAEEGPG